MDGYCVGMPTPIRSKKASTSAPLRRKRGTPVVGIQVDLAEDAKALLDGYTSAAELPQWAIIEAALRAGKPGPAGYPEDWDLPAAAHPVPFDWSEAGGEPLQRSA